MAETVQNSDLFEKLLKYLLSEKKCVEYLTASERSKDNVKAKVHYVQSYGNESFPKPERESEVMKSIAGLVSALTNITNLVTRFTEEKGNVSRNKGNWEFTVK